MIDVSDMPVLDGEKAYWLMTQTEVNEETMEQLAFQGYLPKEVVKQGSLGTNPVKV